MARKEENLIKILHAALTLFNQRGVDGTTMESIAESAGLAKKTLYNYFSQKSLILDAIIHGFLDSLHQRSIPKYTDALSFKVHLRDVIRSRVEAFITAEHIECAKLITMELMKGNALTEGQMSKFIQWENSFIDWIDEAKQQGNITSKFDSETINKQFHSLLKGEIYYPILYGHLKNTKETMLMATETLYVSFLSFYVDHV